MRGSTILFGLVVASGLAGFSGGRSQVRADDPDACEMYECKMVHALWNSDSRELWAQAFFKVGEEMNTNNYAEGIFTPTSNTESPADLSGERDLWLFPKCEPSCGKALNAGGKMAWQSVQEVVRLGTGWQPSDTKNGRRVCTNSKDGLGKKSKDKSNPNSTGAVPPGVMEPTDGGSGTFP